MPDRESDNVNRARAYLHAIERGVSEEELASFFSLDVVLEQFPNRLVPKLLQSNAEDILRQFMQGKKSVPRQKYEVHNIVAAGDWVAMQVRWEGVLAVPVAGLEAGATMRAWLAMFLEFRNGKITRQSNYDCFEPW